MDSLGYGLEIEMIELASGWDAGMSKRETAQGTPGSSVYLVESGRDGDDFTERADWGGWCVWTSAQFRTFCFRVPPTFKGEWQIGTWIGHLEPSRRGGLKLCICSHQHRATLKALAQGETKERRAGPGWSLGHAALVLSPRWSGGMLVVFDGEHQAPLNPTKAPKFMCVPVG